MDVTCYGTPLAPTTSLNYRGRFLLEADDECTSVVQNLQRSWKKWARMYRGFIREGEDARTQGRINVAVVQAVMLYGSETQVTTPHIGRVLGIFHHRVAHRPTRDNLREDWMVDGCIPFWRMRWRRRDYWRWRPTFNAARTQLHSLLRPGPLWTCVWRQRRGWGQEWPIGGGIRMAWTWRGCGRQFTRQNERRGRRRKTETD